MFEGITKAFNSVFGGGHEQEKKPQPAAPPTPPPAPKAAPPPSPPAAPQNTAHAPTAAPTQAPTPTATPKPAAAPTPAAPTQTPQATPAHDSTPQGQTTSPTSTGQPAPAPTPKPVDEKAMAQTANNIFKAMDGWWVSGGDQQKVLDQLRGKSPEEVAAIRKSYADHFPGHTLDGDIGKNLGKDQLKEAQASLSGDSVSAAVTALKQAKTGTFFGNCDKEQVSKVLESITDPKQRAEVAKQVGPEILATLNGNDRALVEAQLQGDKAKENAVKLDEAMNGGLFGGGGFLGTGLGKDKDTVYKALESAGSEDERKKLAEAYQKKTGQSLSTAVSTGFSGTEGDIAKNLMAGDKAGASAARVKLATEGWFFTDKDAIYKQMEGKSEDERKAMVETYNKTYGQGPGGQSFDKTLSQNLNGLDLDKAKNLQKDGKLDDAFAMKYALEGSWWSSDKDAIRSTLTGKSKDEVDKLVAKYQKDYGIDLRKELEENTSGRAGFEINQMMKGEPKTPEERIARAQEAYDFERGSGSNAFSRGFMDLFSDRGKLLDLQHNRVQELADKAKAGKLTKEDEKRLEQLTGYQSMDVKSYQESKDSVANTAATAAAVVAAGAATVASGGTLGPAAVALVSGVAGGAATIGTKMAIQGSGYSDEDLRSDVIMAGVGIATGGAMASLGATGGALANAAKSVTSSELGQQMIIQGVSGAVNNSVSNIASTAIDPETWKGANPLGKLATAGGLGLLTGTVGGLASAGTGHLMGNGEGAKFATMKGAVTGGSGALASSLVNPEMYKGEQGALIAKWITTVGGATLTGAASGYQGQRHEEYKKAEAARLAGQNSSSETQATTAHETGETQAKPPASEPEAPATSQKPANEPEAPASGQKPTNEATPPAQPNEQQASSGGKPSTTGDTPEAQAAAKVVEGLPSETAKGVTQALPPEEAAKMTQAMAPEKAAKLSETMTPEAAAKVHENLPAETQVKVQSEMAPEKIAPIQEQQAHDPKATSSKKSLTPENAEQFKAIDELKASAKTPEDLETIRSWEKEYGRMSPEEAFNAAKGSNDQADAIGKAKAKGLTPSEEQLAQQKSTTEKLSESIPEILEAQKAARTGSDAELQGQRSTFEHELAKQALANPEVNGAMQGMSEKILDYIQRTRATPKERMEALRMLGAAPETGYAGAVGGKSTDVRQVLTGGNVRERMLAIESFHKLIGGDLLSPGGIGIEGLKKIFGGTGPVEAGQGPQSFGAAEVQALEQRLATYQSEVTDPTKQNAKGLFSPLAAEKAPGGQHEGYASAKAQDMDTKLPAFSREQLSQYMDVPGSGATVGSGEKSPLARRSISIEEAHAMGLQLSPREIAIAQQNGGDLSWVQGNVANMVRPDAPFISGARDASLPLQAGISGTTYRFMGMADLLGANPQMARLAAVGNLASIDAHSFHEIASAAQGFAGGYDAATPYTPSSTGLSMDQLKQIAAARGLSLDALNGAQSSPQPSAEMTPQ